MSNIAQCTKLFASFQGTNLIFPGRANSFIKVYKENEKYCLCQPQESTETNFHLIDKENSIDYLIDQDDIWYDQNDALEAAGLYWEHFRVLEDVNEILACAWSSRIIGENIFDED
jgi:hypothetical protein